MREWHLSLLETAFHRDTGLHTNGSSVDLDGGEEISEKTGCIRALGDHGTSDRKAAKGKDGEV